MSKVTKEDMLTWLDDCYLSLSLDPWGKEARVLGGIRALIEKYGDLTEDVVTATSIMMEEERKKIKAVSLAKLSNHAADIVSDIASNHADVAFMAEDVKTVEEGLKTLLSEFYITIQEEKPE